MLIAGSREDRQELMERADVRPDELERSLSDIELANRRLGGRSALIPHLVSLIEERASFLDVGCGSADMLRVLSDEGMRRDRSLSLVGLDVNQTVLAIARARCKPYPNVSFVTGDATALPFEDDGVDVVFSSTFIHHLAPRDVIRALGEAKRVARRRVIVADLVRSSIGRLGTWMIGRVLFGRLSRYDGPASFRRAYTPVELAELARRAGLAGCSIHVRRPFRMTLVWEKDDV